MHRPHRITLVPPDALPTDKDYVFLECNWEVWLALKADHFTVDVLEECWATYREMVAARLLSA
jgi:hypothetical protein